MSLRRICITEVVTVAEGTQVLELARLMGKEHVGSVVVVKEQRPIGILTDRDIVLNVVAAGRDPGDVQAKDIMSGDLVTVGIDDDRRREVGWLALSKQRFELRCTARRRQTGEQRTTRRIRDPRQQLFPKLVADYRGRLQQGLGALVEAIDARGQNATDRVR